MPARTMTAARALLRSRVMPAAIVLVAAAATGVALAPQPVLASTRAAVTLPVTGPIVSGYRTTKCIDDASHSAANDSPIVIWDCNSTPDEYFTAEADGTIQVKGKCLDIYRDEKTNKAPVELYACKPAGSDANQIWQLAGTTLVNPVSGKCLDDPRFNTTDGTQLIIYTCNGGPNQDWTLSAATTPFLYWTDNYTSVGQSAISEASVAGTSPQPIVTGLDDPAGIAVDGSHIYWTDLGNNHDGTISEANLDGTSPQTIITGGEPFGIAVDGNVLYWTDLDTGTIRETSLDGGGTWTIVTGQGDAPALAVDGSNLYWTYQGNGGDGTISEANLDGTSPHVIVTGLRYPYGLAVDGSHIYWTDLGYPDDNGGDGTVSEANLDGTSPHVIVTGQEYPVGVAVFGSNLYWADQGTGSPGHAAIMEANLDGTSPQTIVAGPAAPFAVAVGP
jgi:Ricin-type beta-trefoil lectin domain/Domain of unknown function (DUF5050)